MIIHCTKKLAAKLPSVSRTPLAETSPLGSWHAHIYRIEHRQCVAFCHDATRYMLFLPDFGKEKLRDFAGWHRRCLLAALEFGHMPIAVLQKVEAALGAVRCDTATDRSVLGSMRVAMQEVYYRAVMADDVMKVEPLQMATDLNERPTWAHGALIWPSKALGELVASL